VKAKLVLEETLTPVEQDPIEEFEGIVQEDLVRSFESSCAVDSKISIFQECIATERSVFV
jgi:hypothetical protein